MGMTQPTFTEKLEAVIHDPANWRESTTGPRFNVAAIKDLIEQTRPELYTEDQGMDAEMYSHNAALEAWSAALELGDGK